VLLTVDLERLRVRPGEVLLDAGCGEGRHCFGALERGARVVGLDLDRDSLSRAVGALRGRAREKGSLGEMVHGDTFHLPFPDETFDKVICSEVMEHVHDYVAAARELARVTRPEGMVAVTIPTATSEHLYLRAGDDYFESPGGHIRIFRPRQLSEGLARAGFATVGVGFAHALHTPYWVLRSLVGLPDADRSRLVRAYRWFLIHATGSPFATHLERVLNYCFPKSLVLYAEKRGRGA
jgi:SAM-dependent methyltransferase